MEFEKNKTIFSKRNMFEQTCRLYNFCDIVLNKDCSPKMIHKKSWTMGVGAFTTKKYVLPN